MSEQDPMRAALEKARGYIKAGCPNYVGARNELVAKIDASLAAPSADAPLSEAQIKHMVNRFLGWKLPQEFHPDAGISFEPEFNKEWNARQGKPPQRHEPTGTNLFDAAQAEAMVRYMTEGLPGTPSPEKTSLPEAPREVWTCDRCGFEAETSREKMAHQAGHCNERAPQTSPKMTEAEARELLAREYERATYNMSAEFIRLAGYRGAVTTDLAIATILRAANGEGK